MIIFITPLAFLLYQSCQSELHFMKLERFAFLSDEPTVSFLNENVFLLSI